MYMHIYAITRAKRVDSVQYWPILHTIPNVCHIKLPCHADRSSCYFSLYITFLLHVMF